MRSSILLVLCLSLHLHGQHIQRRADLGARFASPDGQKAGALVRDVTPRSALARAGLLPNDRVLKVNGEIIQDPDRWSDILYDLRGGDTVELVVQRGSGFHTISAVLKDMERERFPGIDVTYGLVVSDQGQEIRTLFTRPQNQAGPLPALFVVGGLSCSSIELYPGRPITGWTRLLSDLVTKSNMAVMRVEKPGVGDSNGACGESDLEDDIAAFRAALRSLFQSPYVDATRIIIYGSSMGSALAPMLANEFPVAGIISDGTFVKTWFEHMLEIERRILTFQGNDPTEVMHKMNEGYIPLYHGMLIEKRSYEEVIREKPWLGPYNYHSPAHMYGRPVAYYHQVQDFNFATHWQKLQVPVRIIRGTNDWIMSDEDNDMIIEILESAGHKDHQLYRYPGLDHWNMIHERAIDSFNGEPGVWEDRISQIVIDFAREMLD